MQLGVHLSPRVCEAIETVRVGQHFRPPWSEAKYRRAFYKRADYAPRCSKKHYIGKRGARTQHPELRLCSAAGLIQMARVPTSSKSTRCQRDRRRTPRRSRRRQDCAQQDRKPSSAAQPGPSDRTTPGPDPGEPTFEQGGLKGQAAQWVPVVVKPRYGLHSRAVTVGSQQFRRTNCTPPVIGRPPEDAAGCQNRRAILIRKKNSFPGAPSPLDVVIVG